MPSGNAPGRVRPPFRATWEITRRCDARCSHCLVNADADGGDELDNDDACRLVDELRDLGVRVVSLTGGEPLIRDDWRVIAGRIRARGMKLRFASNGHLVTDDVARELAALRTDSFSVSVDGDRATHDAIRPSGDPRIASTFDLVMRGIDALANAGVPVHVITSVSRENVHLLGAIHDILKARRVSVWNIQLNHRTGRLAKGVADGRVHPIGVNQLPIVDEFIASRSRDAQLAPRAFNSVGYMGRNEPVIRQSGQKRRSPFWSGCRCGIETMGIEPNGGIKGCVNQVGAPFVIGNVRRERLAEMWNDRARWFWLHPKPEDFTGECAECELKSVCRAGCPALAYATTGRVWENPYCLRAFERRQSRGSDA